MHCTYSRGLVVGRVEAEEESSSRRVESSVVGPSESVESVVAAVVKSTPTTVVHRTCTNPGRVEECVSWPGQNGCRPTTL